MCKLIVDSWTYPVCSNSDCGVIVGCAEVYSCGCQFPLRLVVLCLCKVNTVSVVISCSNLPENNDDIFPADQLKHRNTQRKLIMKSNLASP